MVSKTLLLRFLRFSVIFQNPKTWLFTFFYFVAYVFSNVASTRLLSDQSWSVHAQLGIRASQKIRQSLEDIQRRALQVIVGNMLNLSPLADRRRSLCSTLFKQIASREFHILHYCSRQSETVKWHPDCDRWINTQQFARGQTVTKTLILYGLANFQCHLQS